MKLEFKLNGKDISKELPPTKRLLDVLREDFGFIGVKEGCGMGECGACTVHIDGKAVPSCMVPVANVMGKDVWTIEGIREHELFPLVEEAFEEAGSVQCGFCIPGIVMSSWILLREKPDPTEEDVRKAISGNICRCTGYAMIIDGVLLAAKKGGARWQKA